MIEENSNTFQSPDKNHVLTFDLKGEIRFGPEYYSVTIDGNLLEKRIFGFIHTISPDSRYIALQEWEDIQRTASYLFIIDLKYKRGARISKATDAFVLPKNFIDGKIIYEKEYRTGGRTIEYEMKIDSILNWEKLNKSWLNGLLD